MFAERGYAHGTFLDACQRPAVLRIALLDAPTGPGRRARCGVGDRVVLGWDTWRAIESDPRMRSSSRSA